MSILFSGDFHANARNELGSITQRVLTNKYGRKRYEDIQYHIILGDGGFMWPGNQRGDLYNYITLDCRPFPILCVIGNHEPILGMKNMPETDMGIGETVYQIQENPFVAYLKRGKVYTIDGFKFLVLGGALSIDKHLRTPQVTWWANEHRSEQEKQDLFTLLETENVFDGVLSHTGPQRINTLLFSDIMFEPKFDCEVALFNDRIDSRIQCREWWCGHWHQNRYYYDQQAQKGYQYLYKSTRILDRTKEGIVVYPKAGRNQE